MEDPLWSPLSGPQTLAYESHADVTGYGGAAGGGKTDLALGLALTQHQKSLILRREAKQLRAVVDRAREILGNTGSFNENTGIWRGLPGGRQIEFGGCKDPGDEQSYRGRPHDLLVLDEADQFLEYQYRFLGGWLRTTTPGQKCRTLLCFNPPSSAEGEWLLHHFGPWIDANHSRPARPLELRWYAMVDGKEVEREDGTPFAWQDETIIPRSRTFIPAKLCDNPYLTATGYASSLDALPEPLRSQLKHGDFTVGRKDDSYQVIPSEWVRIAQARWKPDGASGIPLSAIGVDVARGGADKTVLAPRHGYWFGPLEKYPGAFTTDGPAVVGLVGKALVNSPQALVCVDVIGIGSSVYDLCRQRGWRTHAVNFAEGVKALDRSGVLSFVNLRAFAYWSLREALDPAGPVKVSLPPDPELLADLTAARWSMAAGGVKIEAKEDIKKRIGRSPDCADAVACAALLPPPTDMSSPTRLRAG